MRFIYTFLFVFILSISHGFAQNCPTSPCAAGQWCYGGDLCEQCNRPPITSPASISWTGTAPGANANSCPWSITCPANYWWNGAICTQCSNGWVSEENYVTGTGMTLPAANTPCVQQFTVTYTCGSGQGAEFETQPYNSGATHTVLALGNTNCTPPPNYQFGGWHDNGATHNVGAPITVTSNITLTAHWTACPRDAGQYLTGVNCEYRACPENYFCPDSAICPPPSTSTDFSGKCRCPGGTFRPGTGGQTINECQITSATRFCDSTNRCFYLPINTSINLP